MLESPPEAIDEAPPEDLFLGRELRRKIAIVGFTVSRNDAPYDDPEWEIWPLNNLHLHLLPEQTAAATCWFDLHEDETIDKDVPHTDWLKAGKAPVLVARPREEWPSSVLFPMDELMDYWTAQGIAGARYITNSVSWITAFALASLLSSGDGTGEIGMFGIDMAVMGDGSSEYAVQRPSCEYWLGLAEGRGIKVSISRRADLLKCAIPYGMDTMSDFIVKMRDRRMELESKLEQCNGEAEQLRSGLEMKRYEAHQLLGALESQRYIEGVWFQPQGTRDGKDDPSNLTVAQTDGASP